MLIHVHVIETEIVTEGAHIEIDWFQCSPLEDVVNFKPRLSRNLPTFILDLPLHLKPVDLKIFQIVLI